MPTTSKPHAGRRHAYDRFPSDARRDRFRHYHLLTAMQPSARCHTPCLRWTRALCVVLLRYRLFDEDPWIWVLEEETAGGTVLVIIDCCWQKPIFSLKWKLGKPQSLLASNQSLSVWLFTVHVIYSVSHKSRSIGRIWKKLKEENFVANHVSRI
jgi:hypothetical protein